MTDYVADSGHAADATDADMVQKYASWVETVPPTLTGDMLWRVTAYRQALFLAELACEDATALLRDRRTLALADQLVRAVGSIGANIAEGYGRSSGRDRTRFYEYGLGSARESRDWYYKARRILGEACVTGRLAWIENIIRLLLVMIPDQRDHAVREEPLDYGLVTGE